MNQETTTSSNTIQHSNHYENIIYIEVEIVICNSSILKHVYRVYIVVDVIDNFHCEVHRNDELTRIGNFF